MGLSCSPPVKFIVQNLPIWLLGDAPEDGSSGLEAAGCLYLNERGRLCCRWRLQRPRRCPLTGGTAQLRAGLELHFVPWGAQRGARGLKPCRYKYKPCVRSGGCLNFSRSLEFFIGTQFALTHGLYAVPCVQRGRTLSAGF